MDNKEKVKRRLKIQSWRRGMKEVDLILGRFIDQCLNSLNKKDIESYEKLLLQDDQSIYFWISKPDDCPNDLKIIVKKISKFVYKSSKQ